MHCGWAFKVTPWRQRIRTQATLGRKGPDTAGHTRHDTTKAHAVQCCSVPKPHRAHGTERDRADLHPHPTRLSTLCWVITSPPTHSTAAAAASASLQLQPTTDRLVHLAPHAPEVITATCAAVHVSSATDRTCGGPHVRSCVCMSVPVCLCGYDHQNHGIRWRGGIRVASSKQTATWLWQQPQVPGLACHSFHCTHTHGPSP